MSKVSTRTKVGTIRSVWINPLAKKAWGFIVKLMPQYTYATSTCQSLTSTSYQCVYTTATSTPLYVQDAGNLGFELAWIIFFLSMIFLGMVWNSLPFTVK